MSPEIAGGVLAWNLLCLVLGALAFRASRQEGATIERRRVLGILTDEMARASVHPSADAARIDQERMLLISHGASVAVSRIARAVAHPEAARG